MSDILLDQLKRIDEKLDRIKEAYRNGVDSLEEYKENKVLVQNEKQLLEKQLAELPAQDSDSEQAESALLDRVKNVYEIVNSESVDDVTKNEILKSIIEKIVYNKEKDTLEVYYYYKAGKPSKYKGLRVFVCPCKKVNQFGQLTLRPSQYCVRIGCRTLGLER